MYKHTIPIYSIILSCFFPPQLLLLSNPLCILLIDIVYCVLHPPECKLHEARESFACLFTQHP